MSQILHDVDPDEVSPVRRGAIRRRFSLLKGDDTVTLAPELQDVIGIPVAKEGALLDAMRENGASPEAQEAAIAAARLLKAYEDELPAGFGLDLAAFAKAQTSPGDDSAADDMRDGTAGGDDDGDGDVSMSKLGPGGGEDVPDEDGQGSGDGADRYGSADGAPKDGRRKGPKRDGSANGPPKDGSGKGAPKDTDGVRKALGAVAKGLGIGSRSPEGGADAPAYDDIGKELGMGDNAVSVPIVKEDGSWELSHLDDPAQAFFTSLRKSQEEREATLLERVEKAETTAANAEEALRSVRYVQKAEEEYGNLGRPDEIGPVLKEIAGKVDGETFEKLEGILKSANGKAEASVLFEELGRGGFVEKHGDDDPWTQIVKAASELVEKSGAKVSKDEAIAQFLQTDAGREMYAAYQADRGGLGDLVRG